MLYLITNRKLIKKGDIYSVVEKAVLGGVDRVILREKDLSFKELFFIANKLKLILDKYNVPLIINSNIEVAKSLNSQGFHIGFRNVKNNKVKYDGLLGISVHSLKEGILAEKYGADYLLASHIFETNCKKGLKPKGVGLIRRIKANVNIPVIALGGINEENVKIVMNAGADGIAVMSYIMASDNPYISAKKLKEKLEGLN
ncbi:thiamine phosphate synthase [Thermohalobacter berrensis]|uniref:Thiamine-phosphate synthase n=1 Tax=Thermohalobacter berrensis TaxID=99594 RepID=A0A419SZ40_9FIRM|nr:thiamine phosphate synthase [Thermohalobacter berrensis]RKD30533.1 hypothetical protein BET03_04130 [Thermohalobacter berrensis]